MHENMLWPDGTGYEGEVRVCKVNENDRKYHGQGTYIYSNGDKYEGEWKNDEKSILFLNIYSKLLEFFLYEK